MPGLDDRTQAVRQLLDGASDAAGRGDWMTATTMVEAAATLDPDEPEVIAALARIREGAGAVPTATGTRRPLTVMFCDLAGSTEMATALDPEHTREILHAYHQACAEIVRRHDGHIAHLMGDGVLVYFGFPRAHEDDALRAVMAALAMADAVRQLRSPTTGTPWDLRARIGIHTGLTVVSYQADGSWVRPGEIYGETPNLASRVQTAAPLGTVVISADTLALVSDRLEVVSLGTPPLKGIPRPVELFQVLAVRRPDIDVDQEESELVGRQPERAALEAAWHEAKHQGAYVVISGEPGIGKSHLMRYTRDLVHRDGCRSLMLRCSALHSNTPLHPVVQLILATEGPDSERGGDDLGRLARLADAAGMGGEENLYLLALMCSVPWPQDRPSPDLQPEQARQRTLLLLTEWIDAMADQQPLLLVAEDVHWADPSTLDLLERCVSQERPHPILTLLTTRRGPDTAPGSATTALTLRPLAATACDTLIDALTGGRLDRATRSLIAERGDGVPLYMRELAKMLDADPVPLDGGAAPTVPPTLSDLLVARLDSFPRARPVLDALAVLGRPARSELLEQLTGRAEADLQPDLDALERAGVLRTSSIPPHYSYYHALLRDTAYNVQLMADRRRLHRRVAEVLEAERSTGAPWAEELAYHYELAGELGHAVELWLQAALRHASIAAHVEAIKSFELVLAHLGELGAERDDLELAAQSGLAASLLASRGYTATEVADAYAKVRELSTARDARLELLSLYGLWSYYHMTGDAPTSLELAQALLELARSSDDEQDRRAASAVLGYQLTHLGRPAEASGLLEDGRAWQSDEPLLPHHAGVGAAANLAATQWVLGEYAAARQSIDEAVGAADAMDGPTAQFTRAYVNLWAAAVHHVAGRHDVAAHHALRTVEVSTEFGFPTWFGAGMTELKIAEAMAGDADAIPVLEFCLQAWRDAGATTGLTQSGLGLALAYARFDRTEDALGAIETALADAEANEERYLEPELHRVRGELLCTLRPGTGDGRAALDRALATARANRSPGLELRALVTSERQHREHGDGRSVIDEIELLLARLDPTGEDPEPTLVQARQLAEKRVSR